MFVSAVPPIDYSDPWELPFDARFAQLIRRQRRVAYFYHVPDSSTFRYRIYNMIQSLNALSDDISAAWFCLGDGARLNRALDAADVVVVCRTQYSAEVRRLIERVRRSGRRVLFDTDDLVFDVGYIEVIMDTLGQSLGADGPWDSWYAYSGRINATMQLCDGGIATNEYLAKRLNRCSERQVAVVPNFLNREQMAISDRVFSAKEASYFQRDDAIHIGYFSGSPTHNRDFQSVAPVLADLLDENPRIRVRLVGYIEVPAVLHRHEDRIERHSLTDFLNLQILIGSTEINIAPLQVNVFTNCKSELKFFEAAVVGTMTIASPTFTFRGAIEDGRTGFLAAEFAWHDKLRDGIDAICARSDSYLKMLEAARREAQERFSWTNQVPAIERAVFGTPVETMGPPETARLLASGAPVGGRE
jgi:glycosyltransferase involved in cell wall biosynthesis